MLLYKIKDDNLESIKQEDYSCIMDLIMEDYSNYFKASDYLQTRYEVCLQAIYSCLSKVNNSKSRSSGYKELSKFLEDIKKKTGINMQIISKDKLYVKEKPKRRYSH